MSNVTCPVCGGYGTHWPDCDSDHMRNAIEAINRGEDIPPNEDLEPDKYREWIESRRRQIGFHP